VTGGSAPDPRKPKGEKGMDRKKGKEGRKW